MKKKIAAAVLGALLLLGIYAFLIEPTRLIVREEQLSLGNWTAPLRIAVISDIHTGSPFITEKKVSQLVKLTNDAQPDVVFLLGDYVRGSRGYRFIAPERTAAILRGLKSRYGTWAVLGNHDGWLDRDRVKAALEANGIRVLLNEQTQVGAIFVAGLADVWTDTPDFSIIRDQEAPVIVLTHNPDVFPKIPPFVTLTIAGHTHGGQVRLPFVGRPIVPSAYGQRYAAGHIVENGKELYVTTGVGTSIIPVRFRVVPEVTILRIESTTHPSRARSR